MKWDFVSFNIKGGASLSFDIEWHELLNLAAIQWLSGMPSYVLGRKPFDWTIPRPSSANLKIAASGRDMFSDHTLQVAVVIGIPTA